MEAERQIFFLKENQRQLLLITKLQKYFKIEKANLKRLHMVRL
jgi:hypothetical protein